MGTFVLYQVVFAALSTKALVEADPGIACRFSILMEQTRLLMKVHAFARSAAPRFLSFKVHSDRPSPKAPTFSQFAYFLFAPTLVYRDSYPRCVKSIRRQSAKASLREPNVKRVYRAQDEEDKVAGRS